jgi:hypothetical protein
MSVSIKTSALSMSEYPDSLKVTPLVMHRIWFEISTSKVWYAIMADCRAAYGTNWKTKSKVKSKLDSRWHKPQPVWFDVPDPTFATWIAVKHAVIVIKEPGK